MRSIILSSRGSTMAEDRKSVASGHSSNASVPTLTDPTGKPITPLRKFTAGVIKPGEAKQQRDAVLKVMSSQNPWRVPPISSPLDYEKFITERNVQLENDPHRDLLLFPRDDVEEILMKPEQSTEVPVQVQEDLSRAWLLTKEAINFYSQPYHTVCFNYMKFSGDYNKLNQGSTLDGQTPLASLVFESDLAQEEAKANDEGICLPDIIKEGYVNINKNDATLLPNPKSGKKRYCSVRRQESGDVVLEIRKAPQDEPKLVKINSAQLRQTKKGRPILEIGTIAEETGDKVEPAKPLTVYSDDTEEIKSWLQAILRAIALSPKMDSISVCSEKLEKLGVGGRAEPQQDTVSTHSDDSSGSKDLTSWRGRNNTARVLQPPTVERHNMFSLYYRLQPLLVDSRGCVQESGDRRTRWSSSPDPYSSMRHMNMTMHTVVPEHAHFFAVKYKELAVKLPIAHGKTEQIEPFFISMFLFDSKSGRRLSEEFHVQSTGAKSRDVTPGASDPLATCLALSTNPKLAEALFSVAQARDNLWLVCRIDRGLHADTTADVYMKSNPDPKIVQKLHKSIQSSALRLSSYRQRFAWAARPLHLDSCPSVDTVSLPLYRCENNRLTEQDLQKFLSDFVKTEKSKLVIPNTSVTVSIDSTASPADYSCRISSSLLPMKPWNFDSKEPVVPVFEVQPFGDIILEPHTELINLLYVYPLSLKYDSQKLYSKARNITCTVRFVRGDDKTNQAVFDRLAPGGPFTSSACCAVQHHQQVPTFGDEVKMKLPLALTASDHILFSFTHVSISGQSTAKSPESLETPIGYAWCPLVRKNRLELDSDEQEISLPVADQLPSAFTRSRAHSQGKDDHDIRWVENKPIFRVRLRLLSSAFTTESRLQAFFQSCQKLESRGCGGDAADQVKMTNSLMRRRHSRDESLQEEPARSCSPLARYATFHADNPIVHEVTKWTESLVGVPIDKLLPFLPVLLSRLFSIFPHAPSDVLALATMRTIISICDRCLRIGRKNLLKTFVKLHFVVGEEHAEETVLSSICRYLPAVIRGAKINKDKDELKTIFAQLWFFLEIAGKSLAQNIIHNRLFRKIPKDRLAPDVLETIGLMVEAVIKTVIENHKELPEECRQANVAISTFVKKSLTFLDRGAVFNWIYQAVIAYDSNEPKMLREYKNTLLLIVCEHEHWLPLNLPVLMDLNNQIRRVEYQPPPITTVSSTGTGFMSRILGQTGGYNWLSQLFQPAAVEQYDSDRYAQCADEWCLSAGYASRHFLAGLLFQELKASLRESREFRRQSFGILRNLLAKHSFDTRYSDVSKQQRIATLYAPLLRFAVEIIGELEFVVQDTKEGPALRILSKPFETRESPTKTLAPGLITPLMERLDAEEVRDFLISVLFVIHRLPRRILIDIWLESDGSRALSILNLLEIVASVFSYRGRDHAISVTTRKQKSADKTLRPQPPSSSRLNSISDLNQTNYTDSGKDDDSSIPFAVLQLLNLSQEVAMIILDALQTFSKFFVQKHSKALSNGEHNEIFAKLLSLHLEFLKDNWPESIRLHALAAIAMFVNHYRLFLFDSGPLDALSVMIEHVLLQMASRLSSIQSAAAGLLQLILRSGYEALETQLANHAMAVSVLPANSVPDAHEISRSERLGRPGAQTGVALARLLGTKLTIFPSHRFEKGLQALESLVATDAKKGTQFDKAVMELIKQLRGVMLATVSLKDAEKDSIRLAELHVQLADSYRGSAALRSAWFDALANVHTNEKWYSEAAVCHAHTVAIYAKELAERGEISLDWDIFDWISREIAGQEKHLGKERTVQPGGFTLNNLSQKIEQTAQALTSAERYEAIGPLYRLIIPALEKKRDFNSLVSIYHELQQANSRAGEIKLSGKRHLGAYFRVRFIGQAFEKDNDTEWIYKEPGLTSLAEASLRMKENCLSKNINDVQILSETEVSYMNGNVSEGAYMLITHVEPQLEGENRPKDFWTHTNLTTFTYETPIAEENAAGDSSIVGQALKHVVLRVSGQFPSSLKRMRVIDSEQKIYSPLHFACQKLRMKAADIRSALPDVTEGRPLDIKRLQLMLQGAVAATVNAGPLAYAEAFTDSVQKKRYGEEGMNQLKDAFRELISACDVALATNKQAVGADQQSYHEMMATSFEGMQQRLQTFFNESFTNKNDEEKKYYPRTPNHVLDSIGGVN